MASIIIAGAACLTGCASDSADYNNQQVFRQPEHAVTALADAAAAGDVAALEALLGSDAREVLSSGDPVADRRGREIFAAAVNERWSLERVDGDTKELIIGNEHWPFPIPLTKDRRGWWFDTAAGKQEVLARRIGRNELSAIGAMHAYAIAQREYASASRDGKPAGRFAPKLKSDPGMRNGLYWPQESPTDPPSPIGQFAAQAAAEGYNSRGEEGATPYHGYYFRILTAQGSHAPGGAAEYIVNGEMTGGFAMIAFPAEYGNSGIMSFMVGPDGVIYEADLGPDSVAVGSTTKSFDPDSAWSILE